MTGETITIFRPAEDGTDEFNNPIKAWKESSVDNVLVAPSTTSDVYDTNRDGVNVRYNLYFPKTFTGKLDHCEINVRGERLRVIGAPRHFDKVNCPTKWWMTVQVGDVHG